MEGFRVDVLDHGYVQLVGLTVDLEDLDGLSDVRDLRVDQQVSRAARTSYQGGTKQVRSEDRLIDYLVRNEHLSPLEMPHFKFQLKAPLFVVQQLLRHRTSNVNQESFRYSEPTGDVFVPDVVRAQDMSNRQGSSGEIVNQAAAVAEFRLSAKRSVESYYRLISWGTSRELARGVLTTNTFTTLVWQQDLRNLLHLIKLRDDAHAQHEIQVYARAMLELVELFAPWTVKSWRQHVLGADSA